MFGGVLRKAIGHHFGQVRRFQEVSGGDAIALFGDRMGAQNMLSGPACGVALVVHRRQLAVFDEGPVADY